MDFSIFSSFLPEGLLSHFDIVDFKELGDIQTKKDCFYIYLDEKNILPKDYKIIKYDKTLNYDDSRFLMFNYRKILENAEEVHMFQSAFSEFVNSIRLKKPKIYLHLYLRDYTDGLPILTKNKINILK